MHRSVIHSYFLLVSVESLQIGIYIYFIFNFDMYKEEVYYRYLKLRKYVKTLRPDNLVQTYNDCSTQKVLNPSNHGRFLDPYFKVICEGVKLFFVCFF